MNPPDILKEAQKMFPNNKVELDLYCIKITYFDGYYGRYEYITMDMWEQTEDKEAMVKYLNDKAHKMLSEESIKDFLNQESKEPEYHGMKVIPTPLVLKSYEAFVLHPIRWVEILKSDV